MAKDRLWISVGVGLLVTCTIAGGLKHGSAEPHASRQTTIHERGSLVMPFDLDKTIHVFKRTKQGGLQQVRAKDPLDAEEIRLIRQHLKNEAQRFARGNFTDPARLHGHDMPGLSVLQRSAGALSVEYSDLPDGGEIVYKTDDPEVLEAVHLWFEAQLHDHGTDATDQLDPQGHAGGISPKQ